MKLSVIIPAYNAHSTICRCLASIMIQSIASELEVIIVNDASTDGNYQKEISMFSNFLNIKEITLAENGGPGVARQVGIDNSTSPYFTCIDADDTFVGPYSLEVFIKLLNQDPNLNMIAGTFFEVHEDHKGEGVPELLPHMQDTVWMFGKVYRKSFIDMYKIRFNDTRANEDNGFNMKVKLCSPENGIKFIEDGVYYWHENLNSITRINNCQYSYDQSFVGYVDNMIEAISHAMKVNPFNGLITQQAYEIMFNLYTYYLETVHRDPRFIEQNLTYCKKYYNEIYSKLNPIDDSVMSTLYAKCLIPKYQMPIPEWCDIIPEITYNDFIKLLKEENNDE